MKKKSANQLFFRILGRDIRRYLPTYNLLYIAELFRFLVVDLNSVDLTSLWHVSMVSISNPKLGHCSA